MRVCGQDFNPEIIGRMCAAVEADAGNPKLLVRAERSRQRKVEQQQLWPKMSAEPVVGMIEVAVPPKGLRPARTAAIQVRFAQVVLTPPKNSKLEPVSVWAVYARLPGHGNAVSVRLKINKFIC